MSSCGQLAILRPHKGWLFVAQQYQPGITKHMTAGAGREDETLPFQF
jgi:hypothetical protein